ncbi:MAG: DUF485 domain-containing protein [Propionibacterium sp.]|nr:DUF485 domain-containing protein [Propionibacterium sp.]
MPESVHPEEHVPPEPSPKKFGGEIPAAEFHRVQSGPDFQRLRKTFRSFAFPMTVVFMVWYAAFVLSSVFATDWMSQKLVGNVTIGLVFGLLQFISTFLITYLYIRHMNKKVDPIAVKLREELEGSAR